MRVRSGYLMTNQLNISGTDLHRVVKVVACEPYQQDSSAGTWVARLEIHQAVPGFFAQASKYHKGEPLVTVNEFSFYFNGKPEHWKAGVIYEVPQQ